MSKMFSGKVALVTGGSRGIGAATARALANELSAGLREPDVARGAREQADTDAIFQRANGLADRGRRHA